MASSEAIHVLVRVRPPIARELDDENFEEVVTFDPSTQQLQVKNVTCAYDTVLDSSATQDDVFAAVQPSIREVLMGVNCTIFAYGQTSSGKTYTMLGKELEDQLLNGDVNMAPTEDWGVIPRAMHDLFTELRELVGEGTTASVTCSYMQIYNEKLFDLLQDRRRQHPLQMRESMRRRKREVYVAGLSEYRVTCAEDVLMLIRQGGRNRAVRGTEYNEASSRSHAILRVNVEVETGQQGGATVIRHARLNLVDLAGSEKWNTSVEIGKARAKELTAINSSLSALGNCIAALADRKRHHVPYRDAKLTRLLQDSLGGNCRTTVIATLSPARACADESLSTMQFADRARQVMTRVKANEVVDDAMLLARAQKEIGRLRKIIATDGNERITALEAEVQQLRDENRQLRGLLQSRQYALEWGSAGARKRGQRQRRAGQGSYQTRRRAPGADSGAMRGRSRSNDRMPPASPLAGGKLPPRPPSQAGSDGTHTPNSHQGRGYSDSMDSAQAHALLNAHADSDGEFDVDPEDYDVCRLMDLVDSDDEGEGALAIARLTQAVLQDEVDELDDDDGRLKRIEAGLGSDIVDRLAVEASNAASAELTALEASANALANERKKLEEQLMALMAAAESSPTNADSPAAHLSTVIDEEEEEEDGEDGEEEGYSDDDFEPMSPRPPPPLSMPDKQLDTAESMLPSIHAHSPLTSPRQKRVMMPGRSGAGNSDLGGASSSMSVTTPKSSRLPALRGDDDAQYRRNVASAEASGRTGQRNSYERDSSSTGSKPPLAPADAFGAPTAPSPARPTEPRQASGSGQNGSRRYEEVRSQVSGAGAVSDSGSAASTTQAETPAQPAFRFDRRDVGSRISVYVSRLDQWHEGAVTAYDPMRKMHMVVYEDGERKWHNMRDRQFNVLEWSAAQSQNRSRAAVRGAPARVQMELSYLRSTRKPRRRGGRSKARGKRRTGSGATTPSGGQPGNTASPSQSGDSDYSDDGDGAVEHRDAGTEQGSSRGGGSSLMRSASPAPSDGGRGRPGSGSSRGRPEEYMAPRSGSGAGGARKHRAMKAAARRFAGTYGSTPKPR